MPRVSSHFSIFDDSTLQRGYPPFTFYYSDQQVVGLSTFGCKESEEVYSVSTVNLHDGLEDASFFALGTVFMDDAEVEPSKGRIMIFSVSPQDSTTGTQSRGSWLLTSEDVSGCVYALTCIDGLLLAGVNSAVRFILVLTSD
jgi:DNA damage-binding protein 1